MGGEVSSQQYINKQRLIQQQKHQQHLRQSSSIDSNFDINPSLNTSGPLSGPIGGSATYSGHRSQGVPVQTYPKEIVIVSKGDSEAEDQKFVFPTALQALDSDRPRDLVASSPSVERSLHPEDRVEAAREFEIQIRLHSFTTNSRRRDHSRDRFFIILHHESTSGRKTQKVH